MMSIIVLPTFQPLETVYHIVYEIMSKENPEAFTDINFKEDELRGYYRFLRDCE